jgi:hypothetical protein
MVFTNDFSLKSWTFFMKVKSGTFEKFKNLKSMIKDGENKIRMLRIDRGGKFLFDLFNFFCEQNGIRRQLMIVETSHQNGVAKWKIGQSCSEQKTWPWNQTVRPICGQKLLIHPHY